ncbi:hypothetical protein AB6A40_005034 [Gnathostoma spinigerum]|uniref:Uncharacterized protein n=1 Tax=Gnathostoma spinigerum TaxID=75299 RepID=A0ABD6EFE6_9BILA
MLTNATPNARGIRTCERAGSYPCVVGDLRCCCSLSSSIRVVSCEEGSQQANQRTVRNRAPDTHTTPDAGPRTTRKHQNQHWHRSS